MIYFVIFLFGLFTVECCATHRECTNNKHNNSKASLVFTQARRHCSDLSLMQNAAIVAAATRTYIQRISQ